MHERIRRKIDVCRLLVERGVDSSIEDNDGNTPLDWVEEGWKETEYFVEWKGILGR